MIFRTCAGVLFLSFLLILSSCSSDYFLGNSSTDINPYAYPETENYPDPAEAYKVFSEAEIVCEGGDCPPAIGGLMIYDTSQMYKNYYDVGACSGTLIDSNKVLTNAHCVPKDISFSGANCFDRIKFNFPATKDHAYERLECGRVISISTLRGSDGAQVDWAVIETKNPSLRPPAEISPTRVGAFDEMKIFKINYDFKTFDKQKGKVVATTCKANTPHLLSRQFIGPVSPIINVSDCDDNIIKGNSGSGIFDQNMQLKAVLSFGYIIDDSDYMIERSLYPNLKGNIGGGTSLVCVREFLDEPQRLSPLCQYQRQAYNENAKAYTDLLFKMYHPDYEKNGEEVLTWNRASLPELIKYHDVEPALEETVLQDVAAQDQTLISPIINYPLDPTVAVNSSAVSSMNDFLINAYRDSLMVELPKCISADAPALFKARLAFRQFAKIDVDETTIYAVRESEVKQREFSFRKMGENSYRMAVVAHFFLGHWADSTEYFKWQEILDQPIPICPSENLEQEPESGYSTADFLKK